jgi:hypothetical protein
VFCAMKKPYPRLLSCLSSRWPRYISISLLFLVGMVSPVACQTKDYAVIQANKEIGVSFRPSYIAYDEYSNGTVQDSEHGWIPGVGAKATAVVNALKVTNLLLGLTYDFNNGASNHWSQSLNGGSPLSYSAPFRSNDVLFWVGKGFLPIRKLLLMAEAESEYREWFRQLPEAGLAIRENYTFWAPGAAVGCTYNPMSYLVIKGKAGFGYTVSPVNATVGNPNGQVPNITLALGDRPLWQTEGGADWGITRAVHAYADVTYSWFAFGRSANSYYDNGKKYEYEPSSVTHLTKVAVGLAWSF